MGRDGRFRRMSQSVAIIGEMKTSSLDILEKAQLQPAQAKAILQVMEMELAERKRGSPPAPIWTCFGKACGLISRRCASTLRPR